MSTHIECNDCGKVLDVEARFIELPFFCPDCEEKDVDRSGSGYSEGPSDQQVTLDEESATIENTTLLIADLEQQVAASEKLVDTANELIADMSTQLKEDTEELGIRDRRIAELEKISGGLNAEIGRVLNKVIGFATEMSNLAFDWDDERAYLLKSIDDIHTNKNATIDELQQTIARQKLRIASAEYDAREAEKKVAEYGPRFRSITEHRDRLRESLTDRHRIILGLKQEVRYLYNRGLLARIRNA
jgi:chromosome segregation ATPase